VVLHTDGPSRIERGRWRARSSGATSGVDESRGARDLTDAGARASRLNLRSPFTLKRARRDVNAVLRLSFEKCELRQLSLDCSIAIHVECGTIRAIRPHSVKGLFMDTHAPPLDPVTAQQLVARYVALVEKHTIANAFPASVATLPASKPAVKDAVRTVLEALAVTNQLTDELKDFLEDAFVALANYVDEELAALAAEHRRASEALEADPRHPRERLESPNWAAVVRTSRLAGDIARASADEAAALRREFQALVADLAMSPGNGSRGTGI
jgi:hypothetical protein